MAASTYAHRLSIGKKNQGLFKAMLLWFIKMKYWFEEMILIGKTFLYMCKSCST